MLDFFANFLTYPQRNALFHYPLQQMWANIQPRRYEYIQDPLYRLRYLLTTGYSRQVPYDALLRGKLPPRYRYRHFTTPKKDGTRRKLAEPGVDLKAMQHTILANLLASDIPHQATVGYRKGMSVADHAWPHAGARTIITADIQDFFPSTKRYRVRQYWHSYVNRYWHPQELNDHEVQLLTNLTTYLGALPQGAPTSPALSNLVNKAMDARLYNIAAHSGGRYTRYADDIVFSWRLQTRPPSDFEGTVRRVLREYGYRLHPRKGWHVWSRTDEPEFTGVVLTAGGGVDVPPSMRRLMEGLAASDDPYDWHRLQGYKGYRQMVQRS